MALGWWGIFFSYSLCCLSWLPSRGVVKSQDCLNCTASPIQWSLKKTHHCCIPPLSQCIWPCPACIMQAWGEASRAQYQDVNNIACFLVGQGNLGWDCVNDLALLTLLSVKDFRQEDGSRRRDTVRMCGKRGTERKRSLCDIEIYFKLHLQNKTSY